MRAQTAAVELGDTSYEFDYVKYLKKPGETKVVMYGGDDHHNWPQQILSISRTFEATGWRVLFTDDSRFLVPEFLDDADLLIIYRPYGEPWDGFNPEPITDMSNPPSPDRFITDEFETYLINAVKERGMGLMGLHCTAAGSGPRRERLQALFGMNDDKVHDRLQRTRVHSFNQDHPITRDMTEFEIDREEPFHGDLMEGVTPLYKVTGMEDDNPEMINGWCLEQGKGRVAMIRLGHYYQTLRMSQVRELHWRAAHWAMRREIPPFDARRGPRRR